MDENNVNENPCGRFEPKVALIPIGAYIPLA